MISTKKMHVIEVVLASCLICCVMTVCCGEGVQAKCYGEFDVFFLLDTSSSVPQYNFQVETVNFVENITNSFKSPKSGMSYLTFSDQGKESVILSLTRDRQKIAQGLQALRKVKPGGQTYLSGAFRKVIEQIVKYGKQRASIIIIVTDGSLYDLSESTDEAKRAWSLGASVITVGVGAYVRSQLEQLASQPASQYVFTSKFFSSLPNLIFKIVEKSCVDIFSASPTEFCTGANYSITLYGDGFTKTDDVNKVVCSYLYNDTHRIIKKALIVEPKRLVCPGVMINETKRTFHLQMSVNNGLTFISSNVTIKSKYCPPVTTAPPPPTPTSAVPKVAERPTSVGIAIFLVLLFLFIAGFLLWWFALLICKPKPKPAKYRPAPPVPPPPESKTGPVKGKWPTVDASYYGGGGVGGIAPVRVDWGDKGSTEAGSKLSKAKGASTKDPAEDEENLTGGGKGGRGGGRGAGGSGPGCLAGAKARLAGCFGAISHAVSSGYNRLSAYRPQPGGNVLYSSPNAYA